jgi:hypothetical protein
LRYAIGQRYKQFSPRPSCQGGEHQIFLEFQRAGCPGFRNTRHAASSKTPATSASQNTRRKKPDFRETAGNTGRKSGETENLLTFSSVKQLRHVGLLAFFSVKSPGARDC